MQFVVLKIYIRGWVQFRVWESSRVVSVRFQSCERSTGCGWTFVETQMNVRRESWLLSGEKKSANCSYRLNGISKNEEEIVCGPFKYGDFIQLNISNINNVTKLSHHITLWRWRRHRSVTVGRNDLRMVCVQARCTLKECPSVGTDGRLLQSRFCRHSLPSGGASHTSVTERWRFQRLLQQWFKGWESLIM